MHDNQPVGVARTDRPWCPQRVWKTLQGRFTARLAWFILAYARAFATYALVKPGGIWDIDYMF